MKAAQTVLMTILAVAGTFAPLAAEPGEQGTRQELTSDYLIRHKRPAEVSMQAFAPIGSAQPPSRRFEGQLSLSGKVQTRTVMEKSGYLTRQQRRDARSFPDIRLSFVQVDGILLPVRRGYTVTDHPYWDVVLEPGRVWDEPDDRGFTRAAIPFALVQKNMNCTHYGIIAFLFDDDGHTSRAAAQISSETCSYLNMDMWGLLSADYFAQDIADKDEIIADWRNTRAARLPTKPVSEIGEDGTGIDPTELDIADSSAGSLHGLVVNGTHYISDCPTRRGPYPYCDVLPVPSYSIAKSVAAGLGLMAMTQAYAETPRMKLSGLISEAACQTPEWQDVTLENLADMTTGHYRSPDYMADEKNPEIQTFFRAPDAATKQRFACKNYPRRQAPGKKWVYHTTDTFLLSVALNRHLENLLGNGDADVFRDLISAHIYRPLGLSATALSTRRTLDSSRLSFLGYGLQFHRDDIARLASFISNRRGRLDGKQILAPKLLDSALQRNEKERGAVVDDFPDFRYRLGFWARNVESVAGCSHAVWVPFMSGHGGLSVVMYPNGVIYYSVADSGTAKAYDWGPSASVVRKLDDYCE